MQNTCGDLLQISKSPSLCVAHSCPILHAKNSSCFCLSRLSSSCLQSQEPTGLYLHPLYLNQSLKVFKMVSWNNHGACLICIICLGFLILAAYFLSVKKQSFHVHCLVFFGYFMFESVSAPSYYILAQNGDLQRALLNRNLYTTKFTYFKYMIQW